MIHFIRDSVSSPVIVTRSSSIPKAPFAAMLSGVDAPPRWCRVLSVDERPDGMRALTIRSAFAIPSSGWLEMAPEQIVRVEKTPEGFRALVLDAGPTVFCSDLDMLVRVALVLVDLYGTGSLLVGPGVPGLAIDRARTEPDMVDLSRNASPLSLGESRHDAIRRT